MWLEDLGGNLINLNNCDIIQEIHKDDIHQIKAWIKDEFYIINTFDSSIDSGAYFDELKKILRVI